LTPWSEPARWTVGLLNASDWTTRWIGTDQVFTRGQGSPPPDNTMPDPWFRKTFVLRQRPTRAVAYVASIGYHELYVNGQKVGDAVLVPSVTDNSKRARYLTYEIAEYLRPGTNVVGLWLGVSWSIFPKFQTPDKPRTPLVAAQLDFEMPGGRLLRVATDESWRTHPSPNTTLGVWDFTHFGGELYDATKEVPNWCEISLNDSGWKKAVAYRPQVVLSAEKVEPNRLIKELRPIAIDEPAPGVYRADLGANFSGWTEIEVSGKPGSRVDFLFSEREATNMTHRLHSAYILGPGGKGTFRNRFNYSVGRWITIKGLTNKPSADQIRGWLVRTGYEPAAHFESDSKLLNDLYHTTLWTFENLSLGGYVVDCPHRERMGYGGDAHATTRPALNAYGLGAFYTKWAEDWRDVQGRGAAWGTDRKTGQAGSGSQVEEGNLPYTAPTYWGGGGPAWSGICITLPWEVYRRYGDTRILEENFPMMRRWLAFLETKATNNLLVRWGGEWDFLGDWLWPGAKGVNGDTPETLFFNNCYWVYNLDTAARIAEILGQQDDAANYRRRADAVRQAAHAKFYLAKESSYVNGFPAYLATALLVGVVPEDLRPAVWKRLEDEIRINRQGHIWAGITGGAFLMQTLLEAERHDLIHEMATQEDYPSWGDMLKRGATTFWESWEDNPGLSYLHSSYLYIGTWFLEGLAGIRPDPDGGGFKTFVIQPAVLADRGLKKVTASYQSPYGPVQSAWEVADDQLRLNVVVPPNTTATCFVPTTDPHSVKEGGRPESRAKGVEWVRNERGRVVLRLQPGRYNFTAEYGTTPKPAAAK
jgi:alpha-L-rhamnosidase